MMRRFRHWIWRSSMFPSMPMPTTIRDWHFSPKVNMKKRSDRSNTPSITIPQYDALFHTGLAYAGLSRYKQALDLFVNSSNLIPRTQKAKRRSARTPRSTASIGQEDFAGEISAGARSPGSVRSAVDRDARSWGGRAASVGRDRARQRRRPGDRARRCSGSARRLGIRPVAIAGTSMALLSEPLTPPDWRRRTFAPTS